MSFLGAVSSLNAGAGAGLAERLARNLEVGLVRVRRRPGAPTGAHRGLPAPDSVSGSATRPAACASDEASQGTGQGTEVAVHGDIGSPRQRTGPGSQRSGCLARATRSSTP